STYPAIKSGHGSKTTTSPWIGMPFSNQVLSTYYDYK
ncbi:MAG: hypothetical protein ACJA01_001605, partial [Saprospiraceae bacterium]